MGSSARRARPAWAGRRGLPSGSTWASLGLFALLVAAALAFGRPAAEASRAYDPDSAAPDGLKALRLWLEDLGYAVSRTGTERFALPEGADLVLVLPNAEPYTAAEAETLADWVAEGHTLVIVGQGMRERALRRVFGVDRGWAAGLGSLPRGLDPVRQRQPLLPDAPAALGPLRGGPGLTFLPKASPAPRSTEDPGDRTARDERQIVPALAAGEAVVTAAVQQFGGGTVWHLSERHPLQNRDLAESRSSALVPAFLRTVPRGGQVVLDTYHLFGPPVTAAAAGDPTLRDWLLHGAAGQAILLGVGLLFAYRLWSGARLGPPLPEPGGRRRREAGEYVEAMADLARRAQHRAPVAQHHRRRLKTGLGRRRGIDPELGDAAFLRRLSEADAGLDAAMLAEIADCLAGLGGDPDDSPQRANAGRAGDPDDSPQRANAGRAGDPDEAALVRWVARVDALLGAREGRA